MSEALTFVVFGASGDLAKRKIFPALFALKRDGYLPKTISIIGYARSDMTNEDILERVLPFIKEDEKPLLQDFVKNNFKYIRGSYTDEKDIVNLNQVILENENQRTSLPSLRVFYFSVPPSVFAEAASVVGKHCKAKSGATRMVVEKPFGRDCASSQGLNRSLLAVFSENELYRIDHYIGKEIVQNLLVLRFCNLFLDPLLAVWNRNNVKSIQIVFKETLGVEGRGAYFDHYGTIRDVMQNHLLQVLALVCMESPVSLSPEDIRNEKLKVVKCISPVKLQDVILGQYKSAGGVIHCPTKGNESVGYRDDPSVPHDSVTPTFAAAVLWIRNRRWDGIPILLKCGKGLDEHLAEIRVQFQTVPGGLYKDVADLKSNELVIRIQPNEQIFWNIMNKVPGVERRIEPNKLDLKYQASYSTRIPDAYERLILDCLKGNLGDFVSSDLLEASWKVFDDVLSEIDTKRVRPDFYPRGSRGPPSADYLAARYNVMWNDAFSEYD